MATYEVKAGELGEGVCTGEEDLNNCLKFLSQTLKRMYPNTVITVKENTLENMINEFVEKHSREFTVKGTIDSMTVTMTVKALSYEDAKEVVRAKGIKDLVVIDEETGECYDEDQEECDNNYRLYAISENDKAVFLQTVKNLSLDYEEYYEQGFNYKVYGYDDDLDELSEKLDWLRLDFSEE